MSALHVSAAHVDLDLRTVRLRHEVQREWKRMKKRPPGERESWIRTQEAIVGMAARQRADIVQGLADMRRELQDDVPGMAWFDAAWDAGEQFPPGGKQTRMMRSRAKTRIGNEGHMSRRLTPPQCRTEEDMIDSMRINAETLCQISQWPGSISALAIIRIGWLRAREV